MFHADEIGTFFISLASQPKALETILKRTAMFKVKTIKVNL